MRFILLIVTIVLVGIAVIYGVEFYYNAPSREERAAALLKQQERRWGERALKQLEWAVSASVTSLSKGGEPIQITDPKKLAELASFFLEASPITDDTPRLGYADHIVRFKMADGTSLDAAIGPTSGGSSWEGVGMFSGTMKVGWKEWVTSLWPPQANQRKDDNPLGKTRPRSEKRSR